MSSSVPSSVSSSVSYAPASMSSDNIPNHLSTSCMKRNFSSPSTSSSPESLKGYNPAMNRSASRNALRSSSDMRTDTTTLQYCDGCGISGIVCAQRDVASWSETGPSLGCSSIRAAQFELHTAARASSCIAARWRTGRFLVTPSLQRFS